MFTLFQKISVFRTGLSMNEYKLKETLFLQAKHECCDEAQFYLVPPHAGTGNWVKIGRPRINPAAFWYLAPPGVDVSHCPWCGERLPVETKMKSAILQWTVKRPRVSGWYWSYKVSEPADANPVVMIYIPRTLGRCYVKDAEFHIADFSYWLGPISIPKPPEVE